MPSIYGSKSKGWQLRLDYTVKSQSIENNTSALDLTLYVYDGTGYSQNESANEAYYILQGTKTWNPYNYPSTGWYKLGVKSITVTHSGDGTGKVTLSGEWDCGFDSAYTPRHLTVSGSVTLPTIPRASSVSATNGTMGGNVAITITRKNSAFTHKLSYNAGSGYVSIATGVATSYTWASPDSMIDATTNASSRTVTIKCETYNGSSKIGESTTTCVLTVPESLVPSLSVVLSDAAGYQPTYGWVQNKSQLKAVATTGGVRGSTIVGTVMKIGNENANLNTGNLLTKSGSVVVTVTTTDSRGRNKTVTNTITVQQYAGPSIANLTYARGSYTGGVWTENNTGADIKVMFDLTISLSNNTASISLKIDDENRQTLSAQSSGSKVVYIAGVGTDTTRKLTVVATDAFSSSFTKEMDVATVEVPLNINFNLPGACFGGVAEKGKTVQFKWPIYAENTVELNGELILSDSAAGKLRQAMGIQDYIIEQGVSGNWTYYKYASGYADLWWRGILNPKWSIFRMHKTVYHLCSVVAGASSKCALGCEQCHHRLRLFWGVNKDLSTFFVCPNRARKGEIMETFGIASVAVITVITYLVGLVGKASSMNDKWIPILCGVCGGLLGAVSYYLAPIPDFPAGDPITAIAVGIVSGLAATGINQAVKQLSKGE